ncbi:MAG TPA: hypothetical protein VLE73_00620 [Candidatus Saccharimonadales bacterium]|nr:hypothetical protein [Candidatus Saccharimonadales bacterium]
MRLAQLEVVLDDRLNKKAPVTIPPNGRSMLADGLWIITLIVGILQLLASYWLWEAGHRIDSLVDYANAVSSYYGGAPLAATHLSPFFYLSLLGMGTVAALLLLASPGLKAMKKDGWQMAYYAVIIEAATAVLLLLTKQGGFDDFLLSLLGVVVGAYVLFQVRDRFKTHKAAHGHPANDDPSE